MTSPARNGDLHGNAPDTSPVALVLIDVINDLEFDGGEDLLRHALPMAESIADLRSRANGAGIPVVYVNDNFGRWQSNFTRLVDHCLNGGVRGKPIVELLHPENDDYFVLKPKHSGFFSTTLEVLLRYLGVHTLILVGMAADICVLFTANDAYMRDYRLVIPSDCVASVRESDRRYALRMMEKILKADVRPAAAIDLEELRQGRHESAAVEENGEADAPD